MLTRLGLGIDWFITQIAVGRFLCYISRIYTVNTWTITRPPQYLYCGCGYNYIVFWSGSWNLTQFGSGSKPFHSYIMIFEETMWKLVFNNNLFFEKLNKNKGTSQFQSFHLSEGHVYLRHDSQQTFGLSSLWFPPPARIPQPLRFDSWSPLLWAHRSEQETFS